MIVHVAAVPDPRLLGYEGLEVRVADVGDGSREPKESSRLRRPARVIALQPVGLGRKAVLLHGALEDNTNLRGSGTKFPPLVEKVMKSTFCWGENSQFLGCVLSNQLKYLLI